MKQSRQHWLAILVCAGLIGSPAGAEGDKETRRKLKPERFAQLRALIKPSAGEDQWTEIPWMTSLWQARKRAAAEGKPILLWEMDGHPLGCT
jgi:hypothetical protein